MKRWTRMLAFVLSLLMVLSLSACGNKAADPLVQSLVGEDAAAIIQKDFPSPLEYYRAVEQRRAAELMSIGDLARLSAPFQSGFAQADLLFSLDQSVLDRDLLDLATETVGFDLSWLQSLGVSYTIGRQDTLGQADIVLRLNGTDLMDLTGIMDQSTADLFLTVPVLSDSWMKLNYLDLLSQLGNGLDMDQFRDLNASFSFTPDELNALVQRYYELILSQVEDVSLSEGTVTADGLENPCSIASLKLEGEDLLRLAKAVVDAAAEDPTVEKLAYYVLSLSEGCSASSEAFHQRYADLIGQAREKLDTTKPEDIDASILMDVYIDAKGEILGRRVDFRRDDRTMALFSYLTARDGDKLGLEAELATYYYVTNNGRNWIDENQVFLSGSGNLSAEGKLNGSFLVSAHIAKGGDEERSVLDLPLLTANVDATLGKEGILGDLELLPAAELLDKVCEKLGDDVPEAVTRLVRSLSLFASNRDSRDKLDAVCILRSSGKDLLTMRMTVVPAESFAITLPAESVDPSTWANSLGFASISAILNKLMEAGVPSSLINGLMG